MKTKEFSGESQHMAHFWFNEWWTSEETGHDVFLHTLEFSGNNEMGFKVTAHYVE